MRIIGVISAILCCSVVFAQGYRVGKIQSLSTEGSDVPCHLMDNHLLIQRQVETGFYTDIAKANETKNTIQSAAKTFDWKNFEEAANVNLAGLKGRDVLSAHYQKDADLLWITMMDGKSGKYALYYLSANKLGWSNPRKVQLFEDSDCVHPFVSADGQQLFFSSNKEGSFDLYFCNRIAEGWAKPTPVRGANDPSNEFFPVLQDGDLYFSSDRNGHFDIHKATKRSQWRHIETLPDPINSPGNEMSLVFLTPNRGFLGSDRESKNNIDIFEFEQYFTTEAAIEYTAVLEALGKPVPNTEVEVFNTLGERVAIMNTGDKGVFPLRDLKMRKTYKVKFNEMNPELLQKSTLFVLDENDKKIMAFRPGLDGSFLFEILPDDQVPKLDWVDDVDNSSLLNLSIQGELQAEDGTEVEKGTPIYIVDEEGELMAVAYTTFEGQFHFDHLSPQAKYQFQLDEENKELKMIIYDGDERIEIPVEDGKALYERVSADEAINLINEKGEPIEIRPNDLFIIENIYFEFDRYDLNMAAKHQLEQLAVVMNKNPGIFIDLSSHTDSRGEADYNMELSQKRAESSKGYLVELGVASSRMEASGMGESKLLNHCSDGQECTEEEHALNRRTEIRIFIE